MIDLESQWGIQYKLDVIEIPINFEIHTHRDSMSVIIDTSKPESVPTNENNAVCYHTTGESKMMGRDRNKFNLFW